MCPSNFFFVRPLSQLPHWNACMQAFHAACLNAGSILLAFRQRCGVRPLSWSGNSAGNSDVVGNLVTCSRYACLRAFRRCCTIFLECPSTVAASALECLHACRAFGQRAHMHDRTGVVKTRTRCGHVQTSYEAEPPEHQGFQAALLEGSTCRLHSGGARPVDGRLACRWEGLDSIWCGVNHPQETQP